jgi:hypothetical protein
MVQNDIFGLLAKVPGVKVQSSRSHIVTEENMQSRYVALFAGVGVVALTLAVVAVSPR